ncbi:MAG: hypothetical protein IKK39_08060, partial [Thermoguttaceae bacterium]|nr:hypothetical protein [Thermoguttaceae bacterium]
AKERKDAARTEFAAKAEEEEARRASQGFDAFDDAPERDAFASEIEAGAAAATRLVGSGATFSALDSQKLGANTPAEAQEKATRKTNGILTEIRDFLTGGDFAARAGT